METITGTVERIVYRNEENGYVIAKITVDKNEEKLATIVGKMASINIGEACELKGEWVNNPKYGWQFGFTDYQLILPTSLLGLKRYLSSGLIKGVGPVTADRIVKQFGDKTLEVLENDLQRLTEVEGIADKRVEMISRSWEEHKEIKRVMIFLQSYQITTGYAVKIFKTYGNKAIEKLKENPYRLVDDVFGIGFKIADKIAQNLGIEATSPARIKAGIKYILNELANQGHCYGVITEIIKYGSELLEVEESLVEKALSILKNNREIIIEEDRVWLPLYYFAELGVAKKLIELLKFPQQLININVQKKIKYLEKNTLCLLLKNKKMPLIKSLLIGCWC